MDDVNKAYWDGMEHGDLDAITDLYRSAPTMRRWRDGSPLLVAAFLVHPNICDWVLCRDWDLSEENYAEAVFCALYGSAQEGCRNYSIKHNSRWFVSEDRSAILETGPKGMGIALRIAEVATGRSLGSRISLQLFVLREFMTLVSSHYQCETLSSLCRAMEGKYSDHIRWLDEILTHFASTVCEFVAAMGVCDGDVELQLTELLVTIMRFSPDNLVMDVVRYLAAKFPFFETTGRSIMKRINTNANSAVVKIKIIPTITSMDWMAPNAHTPLAHNTILCMDNLSILLKWYTQWYGQTRDRGKMRRWIMEYSSRFRDTPFVKPITFEHKPLVELTDKMTRLYVALLNVPDREFTDVVEENLRHWSLFPLINFRATTNVATTAFEYLNGRRTLLCSDCDTSQLPRSIGPFPTSKHIEQDIRMIQWMMDTLGLEQLNRDQLVPRLTALYRYSDAHNLQQIMVLYSKLHRHFPSLIPPLANLYTSFMSLPAMNWLIWNVNSSDEPYLRERHFRLTAYNPNAALISERYSYMRNRFQVKRAVGGRYLSNLTGRPLPLRAANTIILFL